VVEIPFERSYDLSMSQACRICIQDHIDIFPKRKRGKGKYVWIETNSMYPLCWDRNDGILMIFSVLVKY
jgi:hypothetical protein